MDINKVIRISLQTFIIPIFSASLALADPGFMQDTVEIHEVNDAPKQSSHELYDPHDIYMRDIRSLSEKINAMEAIVEKFNKYLENNQKNYASCNAQNKLYLGDPDGACIDIAANDRLSEKFKQLNDKIEVIQGELSNYSKEKSLKKAKINPSLPKAGKDKTSADTSGATGKLSDKPGKRSTEDASKSAMHSVKGKISPSPVKSAAELDYDTKARAEFRTILDLIKKDGTSEKIRAKFEHFIKIYSKHYLVASAYRHLGSLALKEGDNNNAAIYFVKGYKFDINGPISHDNLLGLARALFKIGKKEQGCKALIKASIGRKNSDKAYDLEVARLKKLHSCGK